MPEDVLEVPDRRDEVLLLERGDAPFAWGHLLLPRGLRPGEKRPVVVAQHGLEGLPADLWEEDSASRNFATYRAFAARLAERGFFLWDRAARDALHASVAAFRAFHEAEAQWRRQYGPELRNKHGLAKKDVAPLSGVAAALDLPRYT